jgi:GntR family transcriptional regulator
MFVAAGAAEQLRDSERQRFLQEEWPQIRARAALLGLTPEDLLDEA